DDGVAQGGGRAVGPQDEVCLLVRDQLLYQRGREVGVALVVLVLDLDGVLDVVDNDATARLDPIEPEVIALPGEGAFFGLRPGQRGRGAEDDRGPGCGGGPGAAAAGSQQDSDHAQDGADLPHSHQDNVAHHRMAGYRRGGSVW